MTTSTYLCKQCDKKVQEKDKNCKNCGFDLSKGRHVTVHIGEALTFSNKVFRKLNKEDKIVWDSETLAFLGVFLSLIIGITQLWNMQFNNLLLSLVVSIITTFALLLAVTKIRIIKHGAIRFARWLIGSYKK